MQYHKKIGLVCSDFELFSVCSTLGDSGFFRHQGIKVLWRLQFLEYLRTFSLKFQKAQTKIEVALSLPCWQPYEFLNWRSSNTPETVAFTIHWYQTWWNPYSTYMVGEALISAGLIRNQIAFSDIWSQFAKKVAHYPQNIDETRNKIWLRFNNYW